ncbi:MAG: helix-turn-helix transcriptional regulator, partial [Micromonosporaceae bacterium]|nr:helix-turn-helix transcriptional regulator [Micromonosporaceae bacterium]
ALLPALARAARARRSQDAAALEEACGALVATGHLLYAAEAAMAAHGAHATAGDRTRAQFALARATELTGDCDGAHSPLLGPSALSTVLTVREWQVADLAAAGHTSPTIAARLGLSVRTVNNHLSRSYAKLGIAGRGQLCDLFRPRVQRV